MNEPTERETEHARRALHALLYEHPRGLTLADVAIELRLTEAAAADLLRAQEVSELVRSDVDEAAGVLRYVTLRASAPSVDARGAIAELNASRSAARRDARARVWWAGRIGVAAVVAGVACFGVQRIAVMLRHAATPHVANASVPPAAPASLGEDHASALAAAEKRRAWSAEADDLEERARRLDDDARSSACAVHWQSGEPCYVSHRLLTLPTFDAERARMALRAAQLRRLLDDSR